jgi:hypothetical protein
MNQFHKHMGKNYGTPINKLHFVAKSKVIIIQLLK